MNGFAETAQSWFSEERQKTYQERLEAWWKSQQEKGWKALVTGSVKWALKWLVLIGLTIAAAVMLITGILEGNPVLILATVPTFLILFRKHEWQWRFRIAAMIVVVIGAVGVLALIVNLAGAGGHVDGLYGTLLVVSLAALYRIDRPIALVVIGYVVVAALIKLLVELIGVPAGLFGHFPVDGITHVLWILLAIVAIVIVPVAARAKVAATTLVTVWFLGAGYSLFVWGVAGFRLQEPVVFGQPVFLDQGFYGILLLVMAVVLFTARLSTATVERSQNEPETKAPPEREAVLVLGDLYRLDKQERVVRQDWNGFLTKELQKLSLTADELTALEVTPDRYNRYASGRAIDELRTAGVVTKKGTVHPTKLKNLGFREDFLKTHGIQPKELLSGKLDDES